MDGGEILSHHFETKVETMPFVGIYRPIIRNEGFLGGAKWISQPSTVPDSAHDMYLTVQPGECPALGGSIRTNPPARLP